MELSQLEQFIAVAETQNMTRASEILFLSQPNISRTINNLESELNIKLFDRVKGKLILNENGKWVYKKAQNIINEVNQIKQITAQNNEQPPQIIIAGSGVRYFDFIIPYLLRRCPNYTILTNTITDKNILNKKLLGGELDIIFGSLEFAKQHKDVLEYRYLFTENLCVAVPKAHRFAKLSSVSVEDLNGEHFIRSSNIESEISNKFLEKHNIDTITDFQTDQPISGNKFVHSSALVFDTCICKYFNNAKSSKVYIPVDSDDLRYDSYLLYKKENTNKVMPIITHLENLFKIFR